MIKEVVSQFGRRVVVYQYSTMYMNCRCTYLTFQIPMWYDKYYMNVVFINVFPVYYFVFMKSF